MSGRLVVGRTLARLAVAAVVPVILAVPAPGAAQTGVDVREAIHFATHGGIPLLLDAYVPPGEGPFPAVVVIPGGKWVDIDRTKHADVPTYFAEHGIAAFAVDYRPALDAPFPAAVEDVTAAVRWVRRHAREFGVNPAQLGAVGVSSGGHLAALVAARGSGPLDTGSRVDLVASWSGPMDLRTLVNADNDELRSAVRTFLGCSASEPCGRLARRASPITYVDPSDPPMVLVNGSEEIIPVAQAESMAAALTGSGVQSAVTIAQGGHGAGYGGGTKILDQVIPTVQAWLAGRDVPATSPSPGAPDGDEGGKGGGAPAPSASPVAPSVPPEAGTKPGGGANAPRGPRSAAGDASSGPLLVAVTMVAILAAIALAAVITLQRRRLVPSPPRPAEGSVATSSSAEGA
jgi:acetyl esterase/lipase